MIHCSICKIELCNDDFVKELESKDPVCEHKYLCSKFCYDVYMQKPMKINITLITPQSQIKKENTLEDRVKVLEDKIKALENPSVNSLSSDDEFN